MTDPVKFDLIGVPFLRHSNHVRIDLFLDASQHLYIPLCMSVRPSLRHVTESEILYYMFSIDRYNITTFFGIINRALTLYITISRTKAIWNHKQVRLVAV